MSPTSGIYWVDLGFINNYKESQLWLVILRYSADVASAFPWVVTIIESIKQVKIEAIRNKKKVTGKDGKEKEKDYY